MQNLDFSKAKVLVVGDIMLDRYWNGITSRISPEAPVPVVNVNDTIERPGGAGNVALGVAALSAEVTLIGVVGEDKEANHLKQVLCSAGVNCSLLSDSNINTITKLRVLSQHQQLLRLDFEQKDFPDVTNRLLQVYQSKLQNVDVVILSDYGKGVLQHPQLFIEFAKRANVPVFIDPKRVDFEAYRDATVITPNFKEFQAVVGECKTENDIVTKGQNLLQQYCIENLLITRGSNGMTLIRLDEPELHVVVHAKEIFDVTGAGDTVITTLATAVAVGLDIEEAVKLSNIAASISISKLGAVAVTVPELQRELDEFSTGCVLNEEQLLLAINGARDSGEKIVMTNGCFDIVHAGHVQYLEQARNLGDRLIVAVNDDPSVSRLKGEGRPINSLEHRMAVLAGLSSVDWVVPFSEDTPARLIKNVLPDVLVKGGDYNPDEVVGADSVISNGGEVKILSFLKGCSTTSMLEKASRKK